MLTLNLALFPEFEMHAGFISPIGRDTATKDTTHPNPNSDVCRVIKTLHEKRLAVHRSSIVDVLPSCA